MFKKSSQQYFLTASTPDNVINVEKYAFMFTFNKNKLKCVVK